MLELPSLCGYCFQLNGRAFLVLVLLRSNGNRTLSFLVHGERVVGRLGYIFLEGSGNNRVLRNHYPVPCPLVAVRPLYEVPSLSRLSRQGNDSASLVGLCLRVASDGAVAYRIHGQRVGRLRGLLGEDRRNRHILRHGKEERVVGGFGLILKRPLREGVTCIGSCHQRHLCTLFVGHCTRQVGATAYSRVHRERIFYYRRNQFKCCRQDGVLHKHDAALGLQVTVRPLQESVAVVRCCYEVKCCTCIVSTVNLIVHASADACHKGEGVLWCRRRSLLYGKLYNRLGLPYIRIALIQRYHIHLVVARSKVLPLCKGVRSGGVADTLPGASVVEPYSEIVPCAVPCCRSGSAYRLHLQVADAVIRHCMRRYIDILAIDET